jgi:hypothetical protein
MTALNTEQTIWNSSPADLGLSEEQWEKEQKWLRDFNDATDLLDWEQWKDYWQEGKCSIVTNLELVSS